jgi:hypothetical protein
MFRNLCGKPVVKAHDLFIKIMTIPMYELMYFIPESIEKYNLNTCIVEYNKNSEPFLQFLVRECVVLKERELFFYKKHLHTCLESLHSNNIFFYFHIDDLYIHKKSAMPLLHNFDKSCIMDFSCIEDREALKKQLAKPIKNKYIPFSLFFLHFIAFSLTSDVMKESSIYELYDTNVEVFYGWNRDELLEVEEIVNHGKNYEGMFEYYLANKEMWFQWDYTMLNRGFEKTYGKLT